MAQDDDDRLTSDGQCALCLRTMTLTFHHLIPKEEHPSFLGKQPPEPWATDLRIEQQLSDKRLPPLTRVDLNTHGIMVCRPCHSAIHRAATNATLARHFSTKDALAKHPSVAKFVAYARKQKVRSRS